MKASATDIKGIIPAVIVPMRDDYEIDFEAYRRYLRWILQFRLAGLAVNVDTGEGPYLTSDERVQVIRVTKEEAGGRCLVVAGCGGPSTKQARANAAAARDAGADALLVFPTPAFLNSPLDPEVPVRYHREVADAAGLPLILFQLAPLFGGCNYDPGALAKMLEIEQVIGLKDASFDPTVFLQTRDLVRAAGHEVSLLTGNDNFLLESFVLGAEGGLLGYGAVGAELLVDMLSAVKAGNFAAAMEMQPRVQGFCDYVYGRPIGDYRARCKVALVHMGILEASRTFVRPPYLSLWDLEAKRAAEVVDRYRMRQA